MKYRNHLPVWLLLACLLGVAVNNVNACTLWGVVLTNAPGGTMISKNRDWKPDHTQVLKMTRPVKGYAYFGLYAEGGTEPGIKEGVNEKGLSVVTASASCIPQKKRDDQPGKKGVIRQLLSGYASCDEVLAKKDEIFPATRAMFVMISDRTKILVAEVGLDGKYAIKTVASGSVVHTNHYLEKDLSPFNMNIGSSSTARLDRVSQLLQTASGPHTTESFSKISRDQHAGPDNSLWRTGENGATLSSWILEAPACDMPKLRVVIANPGKPEEMHTYILDETFWNEKK